MSVSLLLIQSNTVWHFTTKMVDCQAPFIGHLVLKALGKVWLKTGNLWSLVDGPQVCGAAGESGWWAECRSATPSLRHTLTDRGRQTHNKEGGGNTQSSTDPNNNSFLLCLSPHRRIFCLVTQLQQMCLEAPSLKRSKDKKLELWLLLWYVGAHGCFSAEVKLNTWRVKAGVTRSTAQLEGKTPNALHLSLSCPLWERGDWQVVPWLVNWYSMYC